MPVFALNDYMQFPPVSLAEPDGLLAVGGDLSPERLLLAYRNGIFPWYEGEDILWWSPDPRFVLFPQEIRMSKSMRRVIRKNCFEFTINTAFEQVISQCKTIARRGQDTTWISEDIREAYISLHRLAFAHSAEAWSKGELVGGLYGIKLGKVFFGESMFSTVANASKFTFLKYIDFLLNESVEIIDCQVYTDHLKTLGARMIERTKFVDLLNELIR